MGTNYIAPTWRQPINTNKDKLSNYSLYFDGAGHEINCGTGNDVNITGPISISVWFNADVTTGAAGIVCKNDAASQQTFAQYFFDLLSNEIRWRAGKTTVSYAINASQWYHAVGVYDGSDITLYIDGASVATASALSDSYASAQPMYIGRRLNQSYFEGEIGQVCIFDYAIDQDQVTYLYNLNNPMAITGAKPVAYLPLGDNANPIATGGYPNISVGADSVIQFTGGEDINVGNSSQLQFSSSFSISSWVKISNSGNNAIISKDSNVGFGGGYHIDFRGGNEVHAWAFDANDKLIATGLSVDVWYNIVFVFESTGGSNGSQSLYINGGTPQTNSITTFATSTLKDLLIGNSEVLSGYDATGLITNTQLWNTNLSASDVATLYNNGQPLMTGTQPKEANLSCWLKMNQSTNYLETIAPGELQGAQFPNAVSAYPQSFYFDKNVLDMVNLGNHLDFTNAMTFTAWVRFGTAVNEAYTIVSNINGAPNLKYFFRHYISSSQASSYLRLQLYYPDGTSQNFDWNASTGLPNLQDSRWHLLGFTVDGTTNANSVRLYADTQKNEYTASVAGIQSSTLDTRLGAYTATSASWWFGGSMSNAQFWDTNLSNDHIITLYNNGEPLTTALESSNLKGWYKLNNNELWDGINWSIENQKYPANYFKGIATTNGGFVTPNTNLSDFMGNSATNFSWSMWVRNTDGDTASSWLTQWSYPTASYYNSIINYNFYGGIALALNATNRIGFGAINDGEWKHILITVDTNAGATWDDVVKCFINGEAKTSTNVAGSPPASFDWLATFAGNPSNARRVNVGSGGNGSSFHGDISNFTLYNSTLGQTEATALYNNGTPVTTAVGSPTAWWKVNNLTNGLLDVSGNSYDITTEGSGQVEVDTFVSTEAATSSGMTQRNLINNNVSTTNGLDITMSLGPESLVQSNLTRKLPYSSYSIEWDAGTDYMDLPVSTWTGGEEYTVSLWNRKDSFGNALSGVPFVWAQGTSNDYRNLVMWWATSTTLVFSNGQELNSTKQFTSTFNDEWYHLCFVATLPSSASPATTDLVIYLNGIEQPLTAPSSWLSAAQDHSAFGRLPNNTGFNYNGKMSNVAIFESKLNQDDVLNIYNNGVTQDLNNFRITPKYWWPLDGKHTYFNGTSLVGRDVISNVDAVGNNLVQQDIIGDAPGSESNGTGTNLTIADLKGDMKSSINNSYSINMADYADGVTNPANSGRSTEIPSV